MGFDDEVDDARKRLEEARGEEGASSNDLSALQELLPRLAEKIQSRRLTFSLNEDDDEIAIEVVHTPSEEVLGIIYAEEGEFAFESEQDGYFDDFVDEDSGRFVSRLYETLRADLPKFEVEQGE